MYLFPQKYPLFPKVDVWVGKFDDDGDCYEGQHAGSSQRSCNRPGDHISNFLSASILVTLLYEWTEQQFANMQTW